MQSQHAVETSSNEDSIFPREQVANMLSTVELSKGIIPDEEDLKMSGALPVPAESTSVVEVKKMTSPKRSPPQSPSHMRKLSTDSEKALYNMELRTEMIRMQSEIASLQELTAKQGSLISKLNKQNNESREMLDKLIKHHNNDISGLRATVEAYASDAKKRLDDTVEIHRDTPVLVERLVALTNELMSFLPEEKKADMKTIKLTPQETKVMTSVKQRTEISKKKIPKHLREFM
jgi:hypothetical protein